MCVHSPLLDAWQLDSKRVAETPPPTPLGPPDLRNLGKYANWKCNIDAGETLVVSVSWFLLFLLTPTLQAPGLSPSALSHICGPPPPAPGAITAAPPCPLLPWHSHSSHPPLRAKQTLHPFKKNICVQPSKTPTVWHSLGAFGTQDAGQSGGQEYTLQPQAELFWTPLVFRDVVLAISLTFHEPQRPYL